MSEQLHYILYISTKQQACRWGKTKVFFGKSFLLSVDPVPCSLETKTCVVCCVTWSEKYNYILYNSLALANWPLDLWFNAELEADYYQAVEEQGGVRAGWDIWINYTVPGCDSKHYKYLYCCASHLPPSHSNSGHVKMASVSSVRGADHMMDGNISPLFSAAFHSFENIAHCYEERDGVRLLWVYSAEESKQWRLERSDNNSQSVITVSPFQVSVTRPAGPWSPHFLCLPIIYIRLRLRHIKYLSISPPHHGSFEAKTGYRRLVVK